MTLHLAGYGRSVAMLSLHTSPLAQPGSGDAGGMNVYVRELGGALARLGVECTVFTRRTDADTPTVVDLEPGLRVVHITAGPLDLAKEQLEGVIDAFANGVSDWFDRHGDPSVIHANYWLSGVAGHRLKHERSIPLVTTFHTLARVKGAGGDPEPEHREAAEVEILGCSDMVFVSSPAERAEVAHFYDAPTERLAIVSPGVERAYFSPGDRHGARAAVGLDERPTLLFVGRVQPLKGVELAITALDALDAAGHDEVQLVLLGGASGPAGAEELARMHRLVEALGLSGRVRFEPPAPHYLLSSWYRAADVVLVPSRSESFGLVALEAAACGTPVVASAVGGLRSLVMQGESGFLVENRDPVAFARHIASILDDEHLAADLARGADAVADNYTWDGAARAVVSVVDDVLHRPAALVECRA
jgi:D-inositol-3-phosphate glycosyltransferase